MGYSAFLGPVPRQNPAVGVLIPFAAARAEYRRTRNIDVLYFAADATLAVLSAHRRREHDGHVAAMTPIYADESLEL